MSFFNRRIGNEMELELMEFIYYNFLKTGSAANKRVPMLMNLLSTHTHTPPPQKKKKKKKKKKDPQKRKEKRSISMECVKNRTKLEGSFGEKKTHGRSLYT